MSYPIIMSIGKFLNTASFCPLHKNYLLVVCWSHCQCNMSSLGSKVELSKARLPHYRLSVGLSNSKFKNLLSNSTVWLLSTKEGQAGEIARTPFTYWVDLFYIEKTKAKAMSTAYYAMARGIRFFCLLLHDALGQKPVHVRKSYANLAQML